jgi:hypothetical protein
MAWCYPRQSSPHHSLRLHNCPRQPLPLSRCHSSPSTVHQPSINRPPTVHQPSINHHPSIASLSQSPPVPGLDNSRRHVNPMIHPSQRPRPIPSSVALTTLWGPLAYLDMAPSRDLSLTEPHVPVPRAALIMPLVMLRGMLLTMLLTMLLPILLPMLLLSPHLLLPHAGPAPPPITCSQSPLLPFSPSSPACSCAALTSSLCRCAPASINVCT